jgi:Family of unknown function (DUF6152)
MTTWKNWRKTPAFPFHKLLKEILNRFEVIAMTKMKAFGLLAASMSLAATATAHHSAVQFDFSKQVSYKGVVKEFAAINPHMRLVVEIKDTKGTQVVKFEGHSTNNMYRNGYRKGMVKAGDTITVNAAPLRDGTVGGYVISAELADGKFFGARSTRALDAQKAAEDTRRQAEGR